MTKKIKVFARKLLGGDDSAPCWFYQNPTQHACYEKDGSEIWCCMNCLWEKEKIKQFNPKSRKYATFQKRLKKSVNLCVEKLKNNTSEEDAGVKNGIHM